MPFRPPRHFCRQGLSGKRRPFRIVAVTTTLLLLAAAPAGAGAPPPRVDPHFMTVGTLDGLCRSGDKAVLTICKAYLVAVADTLTTFGNSGSADGLCLANYASDDLPGLYSTWVRRRQNLLSAPALLGAILSLREKWPCR